MLQKSVCGNLQLQQPNVGDMNKSYNRFTFQLDALGNKSKAEDIELSIFFQHKNYTVLIIY